MLKCKVCDHEFTQEELFKNHEIVISKSASILNRPSRNILYDAYNCPLCKHQNIFKEERLEPFNNCINTSEYVSENFDTSSSDDCPNCLGTYEYNICSDDDIVCPLEDKCKEYTMLKKKNNEKAR
jgi:hypothetical protein